MITLEEYAEMQCDELGEACALLCKLERYTDYISEEFESALLKEMQKQLQNFKDNTEFITITPEPYTPAPYEILEWKI